MVYSLHSSSNFFSALAGMPYNSNRSGLLPAYQFVTILRPCQYQVKAFNYSTRPSGNFRNISGMGQRK
ncbi:MAG: hypothetical protein KBF74_11420 [Ferruginibacter sp.]|nr:hypothetical protein [Ferruginibacter sp.]